jgi:predicted CoA-substrate-specific enzyme activase
MTNHILGIDIGSVSVSLAEIDRDCTLIRTASAPHKGDMEGCLARLLSDFDFSRISHIMKTSSTPRRVRAEGVYDNQVSVITAAKHRYGNVRSILVVGGEKFGLLLFDEKGNYRSFKTNTSCAAGTGSFLDQQAGRLNLEDIGTLSTVAASNENEFPLIASRCAVFAKTDLIHAQQEGYSLGEISDGLCYGLAKNIVDTLFSGGTKADGPILFCGGVSKNQAVKRHLEALTGVTLVVDDLSHLFGALGAAMAGLADLEKGLLPDSHSPLSKDRVFSREKAEKELACAPLTLELSRYPSFDSVETVLHNPEGEAGGNPVETDIYRELQAGEPLNVCLGIDIGSTSTKAVIVDETGEVVAGFYTRTAGNPLKAVCGIFETLDARIVQEKHVWLSILACGTTGSGRKYIGKMIGADLFLDEITAHARAAMKLNPDVDTIIEIGGQDAKFTTLKNGRVTSAVMNNVCAAGTGSFIEEQARKLGCPLSEYSSRTLGVRAPLASDRCTVFMERDLNHYLSEGYEVNEVLASVLHSVRDNYLIKVANEAAIGDVVFFQGATAKNQALVAAFEQRIQKPILVSRFCHVTGALGTALTLLDEKVRDTRFRGLGLYKKNIPLRSETCSLCTNHCKISVAEIDGETVAYGFLCGRDYGTKKYVGRTTKGFDLLSERRKIERLSDREVPLSFRGPLVGLPAALHMVEDLPYWQRFFHNLSIRTITSETVKDAVKRGKNLSETEFCAPATAMYGHVEYLLCKADVVFLPYYLENKNKNARRQFCYYTQYIPTIMAGYDRKRVMTPLLKYLYTSFHTKMELYKMLKDLGLSISLFEVSLAYDRAFDVKQENVRAFREIYDRERANEGDVSVVFLGRPYTVLSSAANNGIPDIFKNLGIKTFFQDMVPVEDDDSHPLWPLLSDLHWNYPSAILKTAHAVARTPGVYPVYVTSFKCTPDSFGLRYFKQLMAEHGKPYLILELDEHDSSVGYETRIEAAVRSFRNHVRAGETLKQPDYAPLFFAPSKRFAGKNLVIPNWDPITCRFLAAVLKREGISAYLIDETSAIISRSLKFNTGQCIPVNAIAQGFAETVKKHGLDPADTLLWISKANICNLKLYPNFIASLFPAYGLDKAGVYHGEITYIDISVRASINAYFAHMFGGMIRKMGCKIRPYEIEKGATDRVIEKSVEILEDAFLGNRSKKEAISQIVSRFEWIETRKTERPKVAIFGDIYVRDNSVMNQDLIRFIEDNGGEVVTTPYTEMGKMIAPMYFKKWFNEGLYMSLMSVKALVTGMKIIERKYHRYFERVIKEPEHSYDDNPETILETFHVNPDNTGESMENILKIHYLSKHYPDLSLFVQASPAFCCPSIVTEAMKQEIEGITGIPVVSITYDGTGGIKNQSVIPYLKYPRKAASAPPPENGKLPAVKNGGLLIAL